MLVFAAQVVLAQDPPPQPSPPGQSPAKKASASKKTTPSTLSAPLRRRLRCEHPANPLRRPFVCKDEHFDWEETFTGDWNYARERLKEKGITPTASYYSVLQTNPTGDATQMWAYVGRLTTDIDFNFETIAGAQGLSLYFSNAWGTGSNLTARINSLFPVNPNYQVGWFLGEIYLQEKLNHNKLTLAAGRLGANYTLHLRRLARLCQLRELRYLSHTVFHCHERL
jgi:carbohydrate-selective porin OprB